MKSEKNKNDRKSRYLGVFCCINVLPLRGFRVVLKAWERVIATPGTLFFICTFRLSQDSTILNPGCDFTVAGLSRVRHKGKTKVHIEGFYYPR